jgi:hypothetical protein
MATFGIPSAGLALTATTASDTINNVGAATAVLSSNSILGLDGNDLLYFGAQGLTAVASATEVIASGGAGTGSVSGTVTLVASAGNSYTVTYSGSGGTVTTAVTGVVTSQRALRTFNTTQLYGNQGDDSIALGNQFTTFSSTTIGAGAGDDVIGTFTNVAGVWTANGALTTAAGGIGTAATVAKSFVEGGGGNDSIYFNLSGSTVTSSTFQGSQGNDSISLITTAGSTVNSVLIAGGGGEDIISGEITAGSAFSVVGGGGNDAITISGAGVVNAASIYGDQTTIGSFDGNDTISATFGTVSSTTINGGGGNDTFTFNATTNGANNVFAGGAGNDTFRFTSIISADSIFAGGGNDVVGFSAGVVGSYAQGGGGNDTFTLGLTGDNASVGTTTIYGGVGADIISNGNLSVSGGGTLGTTWGFDSYADSNLSAMDTIAIGGQAASASYLAYASMGGIAQGSFSADKATGTNGVVVFSAGFDNDVTSRATYINDNMTTVGQAVLFKDGSNTDYLFIQGGADDIVTQIGTAGTGTLGTLTVAGSKTITVNLA